MTDPILKQVELRRLPFQKRPLAEPGTVLVFQMANGDLSAPAYAFTGGEVWWRGPRAYFVVDTTVHVKEFEDTLPSMGRALQFKASIRYEWRVVDPVLVIRAKISDPHKTCGGYLQQAMGRLTRGYAPIDAAAAELELFMKFEGTSIPLEDGLRISGVKVRVSVAPEQLADATTLDLHDVKTILAHKQLEADSRLAELSQTSDLRLQGERIAFYRGVLDSGDTAAIANLLSQDPSRAAEAIEILAVQSKERSMGERQLVFEAIKVFLDSNEFRPGDLDGALEGAVARFKGLLSLPESSREAIEGSSGGSVPARDGESPEVVRKDHED